MSTERAGIVEAGVRLASTAVNSLGPQFLALLLVNAVFLGVLFWFVDARARHTAAIISQLMAGCIQMRTP